MEEQASALGIRLKEVFIPKECSNQDYEERMGEAVRELEEEGIKGLRLRGHLPGGREEVQGGEAPGGA